MLRRCRPALLPRAVGLLPRAVGAYALGTKERPAAAFGQSGPTPPNMKNSKTVPVLFYFGEVPPYPPLLRGGPRVLAHLNPQRIRERSRQYSLLVTTAHD